MWLPARGKVSDGRARSLVWLEHPADNRKVAGSNPAGPISRQKNAPFSKRRLPLGTAHGVFESPLHVLVENRESLGHLLLVDPHVVQGLVDRDVAVDPLEGQRGYPCSVGESPEQAPQDVSRNAFRDNSGATQGCEFGVRDCVAHGANALVGFFPSTYLTSTARVIGPGDLEVDRRSGPRRSSDSSSGNN